MDTKKPVDNEGSGKEVISSSIDGRSRFHLSALPLKIVGLAALVILALVLIYVFVIANKPVFMVNGKVYRERQVKHLAAYDMHDQAMSYKTAAKDVYEAVKAQAAGQAVHIMPSAQQIASGQANVNKDSLKKYKDWFDLTGYNTAVAEVITNAKDNGSVYNFQGYSFVFWFGNAVQPFYHNPSPEFGNKDDYQKDQVYAKQKADYYHGQLKDGKMNADQVLAAVKKDPKLADLNNTMLNPSVRFGYDVTVDWKDQVAYPDVASYVTAQTKPGLGEVQIGTIGNSPGPNSTARLPAYFYFVQLNEVKGANIWQQYQDALKNIKAKYYGA